jgi:hypothetical protein
MLLGHRCIDSSTGRFPTRDPIKDGRNWFAYGGGVNNPVNGADPTGLAWHDPTQVVVSPNFKGTVIVFGDKNENAKEGTWYAGRLRGGQKTDPSIDIDLIVVIMPNGKFRVWFLPGKNLKLFDNTEKSKYIVDEHGNVLVGSGNTFLPVAVGSGKNGKGSWCGIGHRYGPTWTKWTKEAWKRKPLKIH